ncbi:MAG TPA: PfkB family carbohydrate kinase [Tepidiformaceae bacterium]|nr:PfkB family carbohydrate kinase [Tepidiformaceae bacterium]
MEGTGTRVLVAGNVALDRTPDGAWVPGGPALFSALMARGLAEEVTLVTNMEPAFDSTVLEGIDVRPSQGILPRFANTYDAQGNRSQLLLETGAPLELVPHLRPGENFDLVIIAPAYHEFTKAPLRFKGAVVGVSLQGTLRAIDSDRRVIHRLAPQQAVTKMARPGWISFFSEEDTAAPESLATYLSQHSIVAVLTRGYNGATLFELDGTSHSWAALPANPVEPTGAGDCFATAFMVRLTETDSLEQAMRFALAAGALAVERPGLAGIAPRAEIEARMTREAA